MRRSCAGIAGHNASLEVVRHLRISGCAVCTIYSKCKCCNYACRQGGDPELVSSYRGTHTHQEAENGHRGTRQALQRRVCLSGPSSQRRWDPMSTHGRFLCWRFGAAVTAPSDGAAAAASEATDLFILHIMRYVRVSHAQLLSRVQDGYPRVSARIEFIRPETAQYCCN